MVVSTPTLDLQSGEQEPSSPTLESSLVKTSTSIEETTSSPPPPPPPPPLQDDDSNEEQQEQPSLEDRVLELELKLATLSRLLQQSQRTMQTGALMTPPRATSPTTMVSSNSTERHNMTPYLESPCPSRRHSRRDLRELSTPEEPQQPLVSTTCPTIPSPQASPFSPQKKSVQQKWMDYYLNTFQESTHDVDVQMQEFIRVPFELEYLLGFGFMVCVDCFLYLITILPLRFAWSCLLLLKWLVSLWERPDSTLTDNNNAQFHRRHLYQLIQVSIIWSVYYFLLLPISIGKLYHWIRGQAMLKLYVLIAIVEVFDRLMCSLGQDCLDSMYWNSTRRPRSMRMLISVLVVLVYAGVHTLILFVHVATLNVALNSADQALLTLLISGNFAEIKSTVFKKYNKTNLFKITASDICERFKLALFLSLVLVLNHSQGWTLPLLLGYLKMCAVVWATEMLADWIKHSFITKFNFISSETYQEYSLLLAGDVTGIGHEGVNLDHSHAVAKRMGLAQLPLVCVLARYLTEAARYASWAPSKMFLVVVGVWCLLLGLDILLRKKLQMVSHQKLQNAPELTLSPPATKTKKE